MLRLALAGLLAVAFASVASAQTARRALLVGVTKYPNLAERFQLDGPANDVKLMRATLTQQFKFADADIVTLSEKDGEAKPEMLPTRAAIAREFQRLAAVSKPGDDVVILLGGHGSQAPEKPDAKEPEVDGRDEIFLPRDVGKWDDKVGAVPNAIIDDDLGEWVMAVQKTGAFVWLIVDACHSGTMMRGADSVEKDRDADPEKALGIPKKAIQDAEARAAKRPQPERTRGGPPEPTALSLAGKKGVFALYAAQPTETTPERPMPPGDPKAVQHGVLTFAVCAILTQAKSPVTYRELAHLVHDRYAGWGRTSPTPMIEFDGNSPDREVLGPGVWKDRGKITISQPNPGEFKANAGRLLGLTPGSVLQVLPPAGMGEKPLGHVKVTVAGVLDATVEPVKYDNLPAPMDLPVGGRCKVVFVDYGDVQLTVAVATHHPFTDGTPQTIPEAVRKPLLDRLTAAAKPTSLFRVVNQPRDAAWLVTPLTDGRVSLLPAAGWSVGKGPVNSKGYGPVPTDDRLDGWLDSALGRIARAGGLLELAAAQAADRSAGDLAPQIKVTDLFLVDAAEKRIGTLPWSATDLTVFDKDRVRMKVTNTGRVSVDVTALYVDTDFGIDVLFPRKVGTSVRIKKDESVTVEIKVNGNTLGTERVVLLAVKSGETEASFASLKQAGIDKIREIDSRTGGTAASRTADRLKRLVYKSTDKDASRGASADEATDCTAALVTWQVVAGTRPKAEPKK